jgi:small subunit ribosomal protein S20
MAHTISGLKNVRRNEKRRLRNKAVRTRLRTQMRRVLEAVKKRDKAASRSELQGAYKLLDRAATRHVIHRNAAARYKSRLAAKVANLQ